MADFVPIKGKWEFADATAIFHGPDSGRNEYPQVGISLRKETVRSGTIECKVKLSAKGNGRCARIIIGYNAEINSFFSLGIGGYGALYVCDIFGNGGWKEHRLEGSENQIGLGEFYNVKIQFDEQSAKLWVNSVVALTTKLPYRLLGDQIGIFAWGIDEVVFEDFVVTEGEVQPSPDINLASAQEPSDSAVRRVSGPHKTLRAFLGKVQGVRRVSIAGSLGNEFLISAHPIAAKIEAVVSREGPRLTYQQQNFSSTSYLYECNRVFSPDLGRKIAVLLRLNIDAISTQQHDLGSYDQKLWMTATGSSGFPHSVHELNPGDYFAQ